MSKNDYSVDDILNEYANKNNSAPSAQYPESEFEDFLTKRPEPQKKTAQQKMPAKKSGDTENGDIFGGIAPKKKVGPNAHSEIKKSTAKKPTVNNSSAKKSAPKKSASFMSKLQGFFNGEDVEDIGNEEFPEPATEVFKAPQPEKPKSVPKKKADTSEKLSFEDAPSVKPMKKISGNTDIIESLTHLKRERASKTAMIPAIPRKSISDIDLNLEDKILPNTAQIPIDENMSEVEKLKELKERRKKKIRDFVLVGDEEDEEFIEDAIDDDEQHDISDFESYEDAPSILNDIQQLKGSLMIRFFLLLFTAVASIYISVSNDFGWPVPEILNKTLQPTTYLFINIILGLLAAFISYTVISCGLGKLFTLKADCDTLSAIAIASSLISATVTLAYPSFVREGFVHIYISVAIVALLFNTIGKLFIVDRTARNFRYISGDFERYAVFTIDDEDKAAQFTRGTLNDFPVLASMKKTEFISDFLKSSYAPDATDKFCKIAVPVILGGTLVCSVLCGILNGGKYGANVFYLILSAFAGCIAISSCCAAILTVSFPMMKASKKHMESSAAMISYDSVEEFSDTNSVLIDVAQLFPQGMVNLTAIKIFSDTKIDEAIIEAASLTNHSGSILKNMFYDIIVGKTEMLNPVESYIYEDSMGLCGWINNKRILLGNRELMINHSIGGLPTVAREKEYTEHGRQAVYLSISGELSAMFVIEVRPNPEVKRWLKELEKNDIYVILRSVDSIVSINKIADMFDISPEMLKIIPFRLHQTFEEETSYTPKQSATLACIGRFPSFASLIVGTKRLRRVVNMGLSIQAASGILGIILSIVLMAISSFGQLSGTVVLLYNLIWAGITVLLQSIRKV